MPSMNRQQFFKQFVYDVEKDFDVDGVPAKWAEEVKPGLRYWGDDDDCIGIPHAGDTETKGSTSAISPDKKLIAAASGLTISVFHIATKERRAQFGGLTKTCSGLRFLPCSNVEAGYQLVYGQAREGEEENQLFYLDLDGEGRLTKDFKPISTEQLADASVDMVLSRLNDSHDLSSYPSLVESLRSDYVKALERLQSELEAQDVFRHDGKFTSFQTKPFSSGGKQALLVTNNATTQHGMRPEDELPKIVVYDLARREARHILSGHRDAIMWTGFSPDDRYIASASWDGTFRIFTTETGVCNHIIGPTGSQCWRGEWSPDSKHILLCGMGRTEGDENGEGKTSFSSVAVHEAETGKEVARFKHESVKHWVRYVSWSPRGEIALCHETSVWIWNPLEGKIVTSFSVKTENRMFKAYARLLNVTWYDGGRLLFVRTGDGTLEIWDRDENVKWRYQRPRDSVEETYARNVHWLQEERTIITLDNDRKIRFYKLE